MDYTSKIIDYLEGHELHLGLVIKEQKSKLQVLSTGGRSTKVTPKQVLGTHGPSSPDAFTEDSARIEAAAGAIVEEMDFDLLWESVADTGREYDVASLCEEYFGETTPLQESAMARLLLADTLYFRRKGLAFTPRNADEAEQVRTRLDREATAAAEKHRACAWIRSVLADGGEASEEFAPLAGLIRAFILLNQRNAAEGRLHDAFPSRDPRDTGVEMLERLGMLPDGADTFLLRHGIVAGFSEAVSLHVAALTGFTPSDDLNDYTHWIPFSIDDEGTREIDDALSVSFVEGHTRVGIHIAAPTEFVQRDDPLDRAAAERALTLYLPTQTVTMMPEHIGCDLGSLNRGEMRPTLNFVVTFDQHGRILSREINAGMLSVSHRLSYKDADALIAGSDDESLGVALRKLDQLTTILRLEREGNNAIVLRRPEAKVKVTGDRISLQVLETDSPSRLLVSEFMILANRLAAEYALSCDIPVIYRVQDAPPNRIKPMHGYDPNVFDTCVRQLKRTRLSTHPQPHAGLGLDVYTQISSPLRRYADLVMQRQLRAHLLGQPFPYTVEELIDVLGAADAVEAQNRRLEREAISYWTLEFLRREKKGQTTTATVVRSLKGRPLAELEEFLVRGVLVGRAAFRQGDRISVRIEDVRPKEGRLLLQPC